MNSSTPPNARREAHHRGRLAEALAVAWLRLKLYRILARGLVRGRGSGAGEVDIVAKRGRVLAFVEVKHRADLDRAAQAISAAQRGRIQRAAAAFVARRPDLAACDLRFDAILVAPGRWPRHIPDAWRPDQ
ncbi:hypothetical protein A6A04_02980 [Paramagnetospirillum marisnigri]|uniref:UPF0102 protein A6A04_02980 n=1 Tax=Paramagnetospirillum marisnigri TaxID=1285242 RepID=A0A178MK91_9PROT|nr:YraN family protein [Paramagnetospirillum marisnigri]OAN49100.1 hypothetical protein A6A04_02980 [Paramagnetospirillum marisnigri]